MNIETNSKSLYFLPQLEKDITLSIPITKPCLPSTKINLSNMFRPIRKWYNASHQQLIIFFQKFNRTTRQIHRAWQQDSHSISQLIFDSRQIGNIVSITAMDKYQRIDKSNAFLLKLSCGREIIYKHSSLKLTEKFYHFSQLVGFYDLHQPKIISRESYSWLYFNSKATYKDKFYDLYYQHGLLYCLLVTLGVEDILSIEYFQKEVLLATITLDNLFQNANIKNNDQAVILQRVHSHLQTLTRIKINPHPLVKQSKYEKFFISGFKRGYCRILNNKKRLLSKKGGLALFNDCIVKYRCNSTQICTRLVKVLHHPLSQQFKQQMQDGNLKFTQVPNKRNIYLNNISVDDKFFSFTAIDQCKKRIAQMSQSSLTMHVADIVNSQLK